MNLLLMTGKVLLKLCIPFKMLINDELASHFPSIALHALNDANMPINTLLSS
jgi:hypothetical protein